MPFDFKWDNPEKTVIRYRAQGDWNWKDYHTCVRVSLFSLPKGDIVVDSIIDLRDSTRPKMPSGVLGHVRSFGRKHHPTLSGRAILIGLPKEAESQLGLNDQRQLPTTDGMVQVVDTDDDLEATLRTWQAERE